jgi:hypothetical protein
LEEPSQPFGCLAFEGTGIKNPEWGIAQRFCRDVERRRFEHGVCALELVEGEELGDAKRAGVTGVCVQLHADDLATEENGGDVIGDEIAFDANDRGEWAARVIDEAGGALRRSFGEGALEARGIEIASREDERARSVRRDDELFELPRIDAAVSRGERLELRFGNHLRDERKKLGVREEIARTHDDERVEAGAGRHRDERREIDRVIDGRDGRGRAARDEQRENQRTTLTHAKRRFFEPTRSR